MNTTITTKLRSAPPPAPGRVRVVRDGKLYPYTPPAPTADTTEAATVEPTVSLPPVARREQSTKNRTGRRIIAVGPDGAVAFYPSVESAAWATGVCTKSIMRQCENGGRPADKWMAYRFKWAGVS